MVTNNRYINIRQDLMGITRYKNIAAAQNPGSQRTGKATGGRVKQQRGGEPQFRTDPSGRRGQAAYYSHVAPKAAAKQLRKQPPGRAATQGIGMKKGGRISKARGGKSKR